MLIKKFTSLGEDKWEQHLEGLTHEQYITMKGTGGISVPLEEDCFFKLQQDLAKEEVKSRLGVLHSRYSSSKGTIKNDLAHPHLDEKTRVAIFHNGFIANYQDLQK